MQILRDYINEFISRWIQAEQLVLFLTSLAMILVWVIIGIVVGFFLKMFIRKYLRPKQKHMVKRQKTVTALVISIVKVIFWFYIIVMILQELGIDIGPILASAGILAFAVGFGAQELIKDLISGFFIIFEHSFDIGDVIDVGGFFGTVEEIGLRRTRLRSWRNEVRFVNNGDVRSIINYSIYNSVGMVDYVAPITFNIEHLYSEAFDQVLNELNQNPILIEPMNLLGVVQTQTFSITFRIIFKTPPNQHWAVERDVRRAVTKFIKQKQHERRQEVLLEMKTLPNNENKSD